MPEQIAHYQVKELLGEGSFSWVYRAFDQKFEQDVALKILKPVWLNDPQAIARFKQEAKVAHRLSHTHIINVHDIGEADGQVYLSQRLIEGETLAQLLTREGPLDWDKVIQIVTEMGLALDYAHSQGIVHRDIKPQNILLDSENHAFLGDFGLILAIEGSTHLSSGTNVIGTSHYMAPEVWDGKKATPATDVYALSCVVYEMLTGKVLFEGSSIATLVKQHIVVGPELPGTWPVSIPNEVSDVLKNGLAKSPEERIGSASELAARLKKLRYGGDTESGMTSSPTSPYSMKVPVRPPRVQSEVGTPSVVHKEQPEKQLHQADYQGKRAEFEYKGCVIGMIVGAVVGAIAGPIFVGVVTLLGSW